MHHYHSRCKSVNGDGSKGVGACTLWDGLGGVDVKSIGQLNKQHSQPHCIDFYAKLNSSRVQVVV